tara:strand:+ start:2218 stop:2451 length:234 start_codon:yes stop_codon:yes gene_type:complete
MQVWTIGYSLSDNMDEKYFIEVFAKGPFEAYRNGWEVSTIVEKLPHEKILIAVVNHGTIEENTRRFKIKIENVKKTL